MLIDYGDDEWEAVVPPILRAATVTEIATGRHGSCRVVRLPAGSIAATTARLDRGTAPTRCRGDGGRLGSEAMRGTELSSLVEAFTVCDLLGAPPKDHVSTNAGSGGQ